jgi:hypothetical protein
MAERANILRSDRKPRDVRKLNTARLDRELRQWIGFFIQRASIADKHFLVEVMMMFSGQMMNSDSETVEIAEAFELVLTDRNMAIMTAEQYNALLGEVEELKAMRRKVVAFPAAGAYRKGA